MATNYITIISSTLLLISEVLPYVSQVNGNGIIETLVNSYSKYKKVEEEQKVINYETIDHKLDKIIDNLEKLKPQEN